MGRFLGPHGIRGDLRVKPFTDKIDSLLKYDAWQIVQNGNDVIFLSPQSGRVYKDNLIVHFREIQNRDRAEDYTGKIIYIDEADLPPLNNDEFYWINLIDAIVMNEDGIFLGVVRGFLETGANNVLVVDNDELSKEVLIPFVEKVILSVNIDDKKIIVDWSLDY